MKTIFTIFLAALYFTAPALPPVPAPAASYDAMVVVSIAGLNDATLAKLSAHMGTEKNASIEYSCAWSGVVVLKFSDIAVNERADVITMARRELSAAGIERGVEFLHVYAEARGVGKC